MPTGPFFVEYNIPMGSHVDLSSALTISLVGNGPIRSDEAAHIDASDVVVRMNRAQRCGGAGKRTDILVLSRISVIGHFFGPPVSRLALRGCKEVWVLKQDLLSAQETALVTKLAAGRLELAFDDSEISFARDMLKLHGAHAEKDLPSQGATVLGVLLLRTDATIKVLGFTHEGWQGHPWAAERRWFDSLAQTGRIEKISGRGKFVRQPTSERLVELSRRLLNAQRRFFRPTEMS